MKIDLNKPCRTCRGATMSRKQLYLMGLRCGTKCGAPREAVPRS
jgi:hypothetical protein